MCTGSPKGTIKTENTSAGLMSLNFYFEIQIAGFGIWHKKHQSISAVQADGGGGVSVSVEHCFILPGY